jgi:hypothetical protein
MAGETMEEGGHAGGEEVKHAGDDLKERQKQPGPTFTPKDLCELAWSYQLMRHSHTS